MLAALQIHVGSSVAKIPPQRCEGRGFRIVEIEENCSALLRRCPRVIRRDRLPLRTARRGNALVISTRGEDGIRSIRNGDWQIDLDARIRPLDDRRAFVVALARGLAALAAVAARTGPCDIIDVRRSGGTAAIP